MPDARAEAGTVRELQKAELSCLAVQHKKAHEFSLTQGVLSEHLPRLSLLHIMLPHPSSYGFTPCRVSLTMQCMSHTMSGEGKKKDKDIYEDRR